MGWTALGQAPDISTLSVEQLVTKASSLPSRGKGADLVRHLSRSAAGSALLSASPLDFIYARNPLPFPCKTCSARVKHRWSNIIIINIAASHRGMGPWTKGDKGANGAVEMLLGLPAL